MNRAELRYRRELEELRLSRVRRWRETVVLVYAIVALVGLAAGLVRLVGG